MRYLYVMLSVRATAVERIGLATVAALILTLMPGQPTSGYLPGGEAAQAAEAGGGSDTGDCEDADDDGGCDEGGGGDGGTGGNGGVFSGNAGNGGNGGL